MIFYCVDKRPDCDIYEFRTKDNRLHWVSYYEILTQGWPMWRNE